MKVSDFIAKILHAQSVTHFFELSGGMIIHLLDLLNEFGKCDVVSMHHEQFTFFASDAIARVTGLPGIAIAKSGPSN